MNDDLTAPPGPRDGPTHDRPPTSPFLRPALYAVFFCTGAAALAYEVVWTRWLELLLGTTTHAATAVLAAFMGGLALGGVLFGRLSDRIGRRLTLYGWLEIAVGLYALAFPVLLAAATGAYLAVARLLGESPTLTFALRFGLALVLVLIPTTLMGGTLPLLVRHLTARNRVGRGVAWLYFINSAGAAVGCALAGFVTIGRFGLLFTSTLAVVVNIVAGMVALLLRRRGEAASPDAELAPAVPGPPVVPAAVGVSVSRIALAAVLSGAAAMAYEIGWFRLLALALGSSSDAFTLMLATFIGGLALGSLWAGPRIDRWPNPARALANVQVAIGLLALVTFPLSATLPHLSMRLRAWSLGSYGAYQAAQLALCAVMMAVPTFLLGVSFPLLARLAAGARRSGRDIGPSRLGGRIGGIVAWTTTGNILGTLMAGLALIPLVGIRGTFTAASIASLLAAATVDPPRGFPVLRRRALAVALAAWFLLAALAPGWDLARLTGAPFRMHALQPGALAVFEAANRQREILFLREDAGATVTVETRGKNRVLRINGKPDASFSIQDMLTQRLLAHYPMLFHPDPRQVMIIGLGSGVTAGAVLQHPAESLTVAEISPGVVEAARLFAEKNHVYWEDPRVRLRVDDARHVLLLEDRSYDVVISEPSNLWMAGVAALYTQEFYRLVDQRLRPGGMLVQWIHAYEMEARDLQLILRTLGSVFPHATVLRSAKRDLIVLASNRPFDWDFDRIGRRFASPEVQADLAPLRLTDMYTLLTNQEIAEEDLAGYAGDGTVHVDDWPVLEKSTPRSFFQYAQVDLPEARLRITSPHTLVRRYLAGREPTAGEHFRFATYSLGVGLTNNLTIGALESAVRIDPTHASAMRMLADIWARRNRPGEAAAWMERVVALGSPEAEDYHSLSRYLLESARFRVGFSAPFDPEASLAALERCLELAPDRDDYRAEYAALLAEAGRVHEARQQMELARGFPAADEAGGS